MANSIAMLLDRITRKDLDVIEEKFRRANDEK